MNELTPLRPREFFAVPWSGEGEWIAARWLHTVARRPRRFSFTTSTTWLTDDVWIVHDALTWENGRAEHRSGIARLVADDRISLSYSDMPGGTEIHLDEAEFTFAPYRLLVVMALLPFPILVSADDVCQWSAASRQLTDTIRLSLFGISLGKMVMRLRPGTTHPLRPRTTHASRPDTTAPPRPDTTGPPRPGTICPPDKLEQS